MNTRELVEFQWPYIQALIASSEELEASAVVHGAMTRRRGVADASTLLKLAFMYAFCGSSLRQTAALAAANGVADVSDVALLNRFRKSPSWLGHLLGNLLTRHAAASLPVSDFRLRLIDATSVSAPGSRGTDWRVHLAFDLRSKSITDIEITDRSGGETFRRFAFQQNDLVIADQGYSHRAGFDAIAQAGAFFLVRINWSNTPLETSDGSTVQILDLLRSLPDATPAEFALHYRTARGTTPVRLIAIRKSESAANKARQKALRERQYKGAVDPRTLEATGYMFALTNLPTEILSAADALELYRFRWQIELSFKRLKGVFDLASLPAKDPQLARMYLTTRLLGAVIIDDLTARYLSFSPWGYSIGGPNFVVACSEDPA